MTVTVINNFIPILIAFGLMIWLAHKGKIKLYRIIGATGVLLMSISMGVVDTTVPYVILMGAGLIIGGIKLFEEVSSLVE